MSPLIVCSELRIEILMQNEQSNRTNVAYTKNHLTFSRKLQCKLMVPVTFPECNHQLQVECFRKDHKTCPEPCKARLDCGHACINTCHPLNDPDHLEVS